MLKRMTNQTVCRLGILIFLFCLYLFTNSTLLLATTIMLGLILWADQWIKSHSTLFYCCGTLISIFVVIWMNTNIRLYLPKWMNQSLIPMFYNGAFATSVFIFVMYVGAISGKYAISKKIRLLRGELSIFGCIVILGHNIGMAMQWLSQIATYIDRMEIPKILSGILSFILILIMIPLMITSFPQVRKKMNAKKWKQLQKSAYLFYALIYLHIVAVYLPVLEYKFLDFSIYTLVFGSYLILRLAKYIGRQKQIQSHVRNYITAGITLFVLISYITLAIFTFRNTEDSVFLQGDQELPIESSGTEQPEQPDSLAGLEQLATESPNAGLPTDGPIPTSTPIGSSTPEITTTPAPIENTSVVPTTTPGATSSTLATAKPTSTPTTTVTTTPGKSTATPSVVPTTKPTASPSVVTTSSPTTSSTTKPTTTPTTKPTPTLAPTPTPTPTPIPSKYKDGTYTGYGSGYSGTTKVVVVIKNDEIISIDVAEHEDTTGFFEYAKSVIQKILGSQSTNVDTISGATYSSKGIIAAVNDALKKAQN